MSRYFFDVHGCGAADWDYVGVECADRTEVEQRARLLLAKCLDEPDAGAYGQHTVSATVHRDDGGVVLTAFAKPGEPVRLTWV